MPRPWLPLYCSDYLADTRDLSAEEHGVYCVLLMEGWLRGPLPDDLDRLRRMAAGAQPQAVRTVLERYWTRTEAGWVNARLERERQTCDVKYQAKVERIAKARALKVVSNQSCNQDSDQHCNQPLISSSKSAVQPQPQPPPQLIHRDLKTLVDGQAADPVDKSATPRANRCPYQAVVDIYHELLVPPLPRVFQLTPARKQAMQARWLDELPSLEDWRSYFEAVRRTKLPSGFRRPDGTCWKPNIDWLIKQGNLTKVAEGNYG